MNLDGSWGTGYPTFRYTLNNQLHQTPPALQMRFLKKPLLAVICTGVVSKYRLILVDPIYKQEGSDIKMFITSCEK